MIQYGMEARREKKKAKTKNLLGAVFFFGMQAQRREVKRSFPHVRTRALVGAIPVSTDEGSAT